MNNTASETLIDEARDLMREEVYDGWFWWKVRIETKTTRRGDEKFRWVLERRFVRSHDWRSGYWTRDLARAIRRGRAVLEAHDRHRYVRVGERRS